MRIKSVILNRVNKQGLTQIQIAVTNKCQTAYIPTGLYCEPSKFKNGAVKNDNSINSALIAKINEYEEKMKGVSDIKNMSAIEIKEKILNTSSKWVTLLDYMRTFANSQNSSKKKLINSLIYVFSKYYKESKTNDLRLCDINNTHITNFYTWLKTTQTVRGAFYSNDSIIIHMSNLKQVLRKAHDEDLCTNVDDLFNNIELPCNIVRDNTICVETFNQIRHTAFKDVMKPIAKDMFLLSFYLGGMNIVDIMRLDFRNDSITFSRQKVREKSKGACKVTLKIFPDARKIIDKYIDHNNGKLATGLKYYDVSTHFRRLVDELKENYNTNEHITFYSARKLFAQIGTNIGISDTIIDYILGHSCKGRGMISHYSSILPELAEEAMRMIFEFVDKPEDLKEIFRKNIMKQLYA